MFEVLEERANANPNVAFHRSFAPLAIEVKIDGASEFVAIDETGVTVSGAPTNGGADLVLSASAESWGELQSAVPAPGFQTLSSMHRTGRLRISGDMLKYHQNMLLLEMLFVLFKDPAPAVPEAVGAPVIEPITGRYLRLDFEGPAASRLLRRSRSRRAAFVPAHRRCRRPPVPVRVERSIGYREFSRHRLRFALARQVLAAAGIRARGLSTDHGTAMSASSWR